MTAITVFASELLAAAAAGEAAIVSGNTGDVYVASELGQPLRLLEFVAAVHGRARRTPVAYSLGLGARPLTSPHTNGLAIPPREAAPGDAVPALLEAVTARGDPTVVIFDHADQLVPAAAPGATPTVEQAVVIEAIQRAAVDPVFDRNGHALVLLTRAGEIHRSIVEASGFRRVRAPLPDAADLEAALELLQDRAATDPNRYAALMPDLPVDSAVQAGRGLRIDDYVRASREAASAGRSVHLDDLRGRKSASIERLARETLRLHPEGRTLADVAGLSHIRRYIAERQQSGTWPQSLLFAGPPGVGKTFVVRAIAAELNRPCAVFHLVRSPWVGETEANTAHALALIDDLAPIVVHIDEVDRALGQRSTGPSADAGTSERFQATLWEYTGEGASRPDVLFCLTTNRTDLLDEAQRNRVEVVPILHPTPREVAQLVPALAKQLGRELADDVDQGEIAAHPKLRLTSARHLLRILGRAATLADLGASSPGAAIARAHVVDAIDDYLPHTDAVEEELMALTALSRTSFRSLLPWIAAEEAGLPREVPFYVSPLLDDDGELDQAGLRKRLAHLSDELALRRARKQW